MVNDPGTPTKAESASGGSSPPSPPNAIPEVDSGWFDADEAAGIPVTVTEAIVADNSLVQIEANLGSADSVIPTAVGLAVAVTDTIDKPVEAVTVSGDPAPAPRPSTDNATGQPTTKLEPAEAASVEPVTTNATEKSTGSLIPQSLSPVVLASPGALPSVPPAAEQPRPTPEAKLEQPTTPGDAVAESKLRAQSESLESKESSPATQSTADQAAKPPLTNGATPAAKSAEPRTVSLPRRLPRYAWVGAAAIAAGLVLVATRHGNPPPNGSGAQPSPAAQRQQPAAVDVAPNERSGVVDTQASAALPVVAAAGSAAPATPPAVRAVASAATSASAPATSASNAAPAADDSFANAFAKHAAKKNAKWGELKVPASKSDGAKSTKGDASNPPAAAKPASQPDPMDVLKRLEESRKSRRQ